MTTTRIKFSSWGSKHITNEHAIDDGCNAKAECVARAIAKKTFGRGGLFMYLQSQAAAKSFVALIGDRDFTKPVKIFFALDATCNS